MSMIDNDWLAPLSEEFKKPYYKSLYDRVKKEYQTTTVYPPADDIFNAFHHTPLSQVKVVILGQDPYHEPGQAHGLCFSVQKGVKIPPSLENIYKELHDDVGFVIPDHGCLTGWADQGVFLLNTVLTVRAHEANSHASFGWLNFTDAVIGILDRVERPMVFMLWGAPAGKKAELLHNPGHLILKAPHPSPLSAYRGFFGCRHFSKCNQYLKDNGLSPINWQI